MLILVFKLRCGAVYSAHIRLKVANDRSSFFERYIGSIPALGAPFRGSAQARGRAGEESC
jgi:hypothetical protein